MSLRLLISHLGIGLDSYLKAKRDHKKAEAVRAEGAADRTAEDLRLLAELMAYWPKERRGAFGTYGPTGLALDAFKVVDRLFPEGPCP